MHAALQDTVQLHEDTEAVNLKELLGPLDTIKAKKLAVLWQKVQEAEEAKEIYRKLNDNVGATTAIKSVQSSQASNDGDAEVEAPEPADESSGVKHLKPKVEETVNVTTSEDRGKIG